MTDVIWVKLLYRDVQVFAYTNNGVVILDPNLVDESSSKGKIFFQDLAVVGRSVRELPNFNLKTPVDSLQEIRPQRISSKPSGSTIGSRCCNPENIPLPR